MKINCVQQASISNQVSISTFAKWQHGYFSLLLARGRHCDAERAIRWALPRIFSFLLLYFVIARYIRLHWHLVCKRLAHTCTGVRVLASALTCSDLAVTCNRITYAKQAINHCENVWQLFHSSYLSIFNFRLLNSGSHFLPNYQKLTKIPICAGMCTRGNAAV